MANQNSIADLSTTPANNLNFRGQSMQGSAPVSTIDSMFQNEAAMLKAFYDSIGGAATAGGTATAVTVTVTEKWADHAHGNILAVKMPNAATGAATIVITTPDGALSSKKIRRQGDSAIQANDWGANATVWLKYDSAYDTAAGAYVLLFGTAIPPATPITEANGGTNQTTYTQGDLLYASAANTLAKLAKGTQGAVLTQTSTIPAWGSAFTMSGEVSASGSALSFTGIPSYATMILAISRGLSSNGTAEIKLQLGTSGGYQTTGYLESGMSAAAGGNSLTNDTAGFNLFTNGGGAAFTRHGIILLVKTNSTTWVAFGGVGLSDSGRLSIVGGSKDLSGTLDRVQFVTTDTLDAGSANVGWA